MKRLGKDIRKPYYGGRANSPSCRPGGSCPWCQAGRRHVREKRAPIAEPVEQPPLARVGQGIALACLSLVLAGCSTSPGRISTDATRSETPAGMRVVEKTTTTTTKTGDTVTTREHQSEPVLAVVQTTTGAATNDNPALGPLVGSGADGLAFRTSGAQVARRTATPYVLGGCALIAFGVIGLFAKSWLAAVLPFDMPTQAPVIAIYAGIALACVPVLGDMLADPMNVLILVAGGVAVAYGTGLFSNAKKAAKARQARKARVVASAIPPTHERKASQP